MPDEEEGQTLPENVKHEASIKIGDAISKIKVNKELNVNLK